MDVAPWIVTPQKERKTEVGDPLTYKRTKLVELLKAKLQERKDRQAEEHKKRQERNQKVIDQIVDLSSSRPGFLVNLVLLLQEEYEANPGTEAFDEKVKKFYPEPAPGGDIDSSLERLIRMYENADDDTVNVSVTDDVARYL